MPYDIYDDSGRKIGYVTTPAEKAAALTLLPFMILGGACLAFLLLGGWQIIYFIIPVALAVVVFRLLRSKWPKVIKVLIGIPLVYVTIYVWIYFLIAIGGIIYALLTTAIRIILNK
jgi:hypothetical protein